MEQDSGDFDLVVDNSGPGRRIESEALIKHLEEHAWIWRAQRLCSPDNPAMNVRRDRNSEELIFSPELLQMLDEEGVDWRS